jgi:predicted RNase H-like nuclease (RuvC/YqgF family)
LYTTKHFKDFAHGRSVEDNNICAIIAKENVKILSDVAESINVEQNSGFVELCTEDEFTTMMKNIARGEIEELNARIQEADRKVEESENTIEQMDIQNQEIQNDLMEAESRNQEFVSDIQELNNIIKNMRKEMEDLMKRMSRSEKEHKSVLMELHEYKILYPEPDVPVNTPFPPPSSGPRASLSPNQKNMSKKN